MYAYFHKNLNSYLHYSPKTTQRGVIFTNHCTVTAQLKGPPEVFEEVQALVDYSNSN